ncbi:MAG: 2-amino-4-hydroxy-6-hydroxymethyldihydropteridine diphosphokinase [Paraglaciecola sp.]|jgi:2-amino-4-hydroxy-6-hydroxymethyldihydropteridine diphosphokinase
MVACESLHCIFISVGSNINREKHIKSGLDAMHQAFGSMRLSAVYESESIGFKGRNFYNLVVQASTDLGVMDVVQILKKIERNNLRSHEGKKFSPRTLDLDLLLYDELTTLSPVELPRGEIMYNAFVLQPLAEIAPLVTHPISGETYQTLWHKYDKTTQHLWPIDFIWSADPQ